MARTVKVAIAGLGPVGQAVARAVLQTPGLKLVAAADPSPLHAGRDVAVVLGLPRKLQGQGRGPRPSASSRRCAPTWPSSAPPRTSRRSSRRWRRCSSRRINVLTTCEELVHSVPARAAAFKELDRLAKRKKVSLLATGVNPGFAMDALALALTAPCARVRRISVTRVVDAAARKLALQRRVGAGLNLGQFRRAVTEGTVRHVGLVESAYLIATGARLEARPRGRDARARDRAARPRHPGAAHPRRRRRRHPPVREGLPLGRARDQPRPAGVRGRRVAARPHPGRRRPVDRHDASRAASTARRRPRRSWSTACRGCSPRRRGC